MITLHTNFGTIEIELYKDKAPVSAKNFTRYCQEHFYDGTIFHRVIDGFMIQGGGLNKDLEEKPTRVAIVNEANRGLKNVKGSIAMARTEAPHSATAEFFINLADNAFLDHTATTNKGWGYAVFGQVVIGMEVVEKIAKTATETRKGYDDVPVEAIVIESVTVTP
jgi:peptidyl-prolyl cis-trans isomerase B (cyclophilin B)